MSNHAAIAMLCASVAILLPFGGYVAQWLKRRAWEDGETR